MYYWEDDLKEGERMVIERMEMEYLERNRSLAEVGECGEKRLGEREKKCD